MFRKTGRMFRRGIWGLVVLAVCSGFPGRPLPPERINLVNHEPRFAGGPEIGVCACFAPGTDPAYMDDVARQLRRGAQAYVADARWTHTATDGPVGGRDAITLTYSFVPDVNTGTTETSNSIHATLDAQFGSRDAWKMLFRGIFDGWSANTGIRFEEVEDDGAPWPNSAGLVGVRGDIRIVAQPIDGPDGVLAFNYFPNSGDMTLDSAEFWAASQLDYRFLRNTLLHELGHGIGLGHVNPRNGEKLMEAVLNLNINGAQDDDIRGANSFYGDPHEPNDVVATALGEFVDGMSVTALSLHSIDDVDVFLVSADAGVSIDVTAAPIGSTYLTGPDPGSPASVNTRAVMPLKVSVTSADESVVFGAAMAANAGDAVTVRGVTVPAGMSALRIVVGSDGSSDDVQRYTLSLTRGETQFHVLTLDSEPVGATFSLSPAASGGAASAVSPASVQYTSGQTVQAEAPASHAGLGFVRWVVDGAESPAGQRIAQIVMIGNHSLLARYSDALVVDAFGGGMIEPGAMVRLTASAAGGAPPYSYAWTPSETLTGANSASPLAMPTEPTTYTVTATDALGAQAMNSVAIDLRAALRVDAGPDRTVPGGARILLEGAASGGNPPYSFAWSPATGIANPSNPRTEAQVFVTRTYTLTVTDSASQSATDTVAVRVAPAVNVSLGPDRVSVRGRTVELNPTITGGVPPYTVVWDEVDGATRIGDALLVMPTKTTTYSVFVNDAAGQQGSDSIEIEIAAPLTCEAGANPVRIPAGASTRLLAEVSGGLPPYQIEWSPAAWVDQREAFQTGATPAETTRFIVTVHDALQQAATAEITVEVITAQDKGNSGLAVETLAIQSVTGPCGAMSSALLLTALLGIAGRRSQGD